MCVCIDVNYIALSARFVPHTNRGAGTQTSVNEIVRVPVTVCSTTTRRRVFVDKLDAHDFVPSIGDQIYAVVMLLEVPVVR